jgi:predicted HicB family RNase H-like nuclease
MEARITQHEWMNYDTVVKIQCHNRIELERDLIKMMRPIHNKSHNIKDEVFSTNLRINPVLAERVKESAEAAKRSMNKEIELALEEKYLV